MTKLPLYLAGAAAVAAPVSIAACQILMGATAAALIGTRSRWRFPPVWIPLLLFMLGTLLSGAASGHFRAGFPQYKKFIVYVMLFLVTSTIASMQQVKWIALGWAAGAALSSAWALNQFFNKYQDAVEAHQDFYRAYVGDRITGFANHWMTFSGEMMMALMIIAALVFFAPYKQWRWWLVAAGALVSVALVLAYTRSMWVAAAVGGAYLLWVWKKWTVLAIPVFAGLVVLANPFGLGERAMSAFRPHGEIDSNQHRVITRRVGWEMIKAHPLLGVGPQQVGPQFRNYMPADLSRKLPEGYYEHLHNIYIHYAAERGIPTMLALMFVVARALWDFAGGVRRIESGAEQRWILHGAIAVILAILVGGWSEYNINDSEVLSMFLAVLGCGYVALWEADKTCLR
ncbi:MAG TPA: O-antigen ligase family protein [Bryobacteraceae bacterium]|jgi:O-antigen ligase|nr:O-antigen ligase family protein [Bryobacteraceae bacterium]